MAASVWIAPAIWNAVSPLIERSTAEMTPTDSDWRSLNGEPIAANRHPHRDAVRAPERERPQRQPFGRP
jgi:hypothetical protein